MLTCIYYNLTGMPPITLTEAILKPTKKLCFLSEISWEVGVYKRRAEMTRDDMYMQANIVDWTFW